MIKKILIGVDDSKYAENAAKYGFKLAEIYNAHVGLVNILEPIAMPMSGTGADEILGASLQRINMSDMEVMDAQTQISERIIDGIAKKFAGKLLVTHFNEYGSTGEGIISCSKEFKADIIVVGTHERTGLDRFFSGSVAEYVVRHSDIPVLVVPMKKS
jgi:nucleotide-binding universal stress UspA family protein